MRNCCVSQVPFWIVLHEPGGGLLPPVGAILKALTSRMKAQTNAVAQMSLCGLFSSNGIPSKIAEDDREHVIRSENVNPDNHEKHPGRIG